MSKEASTSEEDRLAAVKAIPFDKLREDEFDAVLLEELACLLFGHGCPLGRCRCDPLQA